MYKDVKPAQIFRRYFFHSTGLFTMDAARVIANFKKRLKKKTHELPVSDNPTKQGPLILGKRSMDSEKTFPQDVLTRKT